MTHLQKLRFAGDLETWQKEVENQLNTLFSVFVHEHEENDRLRTELSSSSGKGNLAQAPGIQIPDACLMVGTGRE